MMPSRPRASRRIGTSSEALRVGPWARQRIGTSSKALWAGPRARRRIDISFEALRAGPRASRRIGTSSEALRVGPRASQRIGTSSEASRVGPRASWRIGTSSEASWFRSGPSPLRVSPDIVRGGPGGPAEPRIRWGFAGGCLLASIFTRSKRFFGSCLGDPFLWYPTVAPEPRGECERSS